jgi:hypothetical protein
VRRGKHSQRHDPESQPQEREAEHPAGTTKEPEYHYGRSALKNRSCFMVPCIGSSISLRPEFQWLHSVGCSIDGREAGES